LIAKACARFGAIEDEIANELNIGPATLDRWKQKYPEFRCALKAGKAESDDRVERSLLPARNRLERAAAKHDRSDILVEEQTA
jgi:hypothetical protein